MVYTCDVDHLSASSLLPGAGGAPRPPGMVRPPLPGMSLTSHLGIGRRSSLSAKSAERSQNQAATIFDTRGRLISACSTIPRANHAAPRARLVWGSIHD